MSVPNVETMVVELMTSAVRWYLLDELAKEEDDDPLDCDESIKTRSITNVHSEMRQCSEELAALMDTIRTSETVIDPTTSRLSDCRSQMKDVHIEKKKLRRAQVLIEKENELNACDERLRPTLEKEGIMLERLVELVVHMNKDVDRKALLEKCAELKGEIGNMQQFVNTDQPKQMERLADIRRKMERVLQSHNKKHDSKNNEENDLQPPSAGQEASKKRECNAQIKTLLAGIRGLPYVLADQLRFDAGSHGLEVPFADDNGSRRMVVRLMFKRHELPSTGFAVGDVQISGDDVDNVQDWLDDNSGIVSADVVVFLAKLHDQWTTSD